MPKLDETERRAYMWLRKHDESLIDALVLLGYQMRLWQGMYVWVKKDRR